MFYKPTKIGQLLQDTKDKGQPLSTPGVYRILSLTAKYTYMKPGGWLAHAKKKHQAAVRLKHVTQSALAKHTLKTGHYYLIWTDFFTSQDK